MKPKQQKTQQNGKKCETCALYIFIVAKSLMRAAIFKKHLKKVWKVIVCHTVIMYGFCSSNVLYSASLSFRMFIFVLTLFDTWD